MLKTCFLPVNYTNFANKLCGEIICQTETSFTIICKLCDIKLFEYEEFIKHFRTAHWPEICNKFNQSIPIVKEGEEIKSENRTVEQDIKVENQINLSLVNNKPKDSSNDSDDEEAVSDRETRTVDDDFDTDDSTQPLAILQKVKIMF